MRYIDKGYPLLHWATTVEVICPLCGKVGIIKGNPLWNDWRANFYCHSCSHTLKTEQSGWHGPVLGIGRRPCGSCGHQWIYLEKQFNKYSDIKSHSCKIQCPVCNSTNLIDLKFIRTEPDDHSVDPYFGLDLALKERTRHGIIWVYNGEHLSNLKSYVEANIRVSSGTKWSYFTRLPKWIKAGKNRDTVLNAIKKLEKRISENTF